MKIIKGGVTKPKGFKANGLYCGIKRSGKFDLSLIVSDVTASAAGIFTSNSVKAAPVLVSQKHINKGKARAIFVNSGNANCFTKKEGIKNAYSMAEIASVLLKSKKEEIIVSSTGIIGRQLPIEKIALGARELFKGLGKTPSHANKAALGIMTTDLKPKESAVEFSLNGKIVSIGGCAKGCGMIDPNMATMLAFITTDANISPKLLKKALIEAADMSFNCITIDGCMSTNDMAIVLANGLAGNKKITAAGKDYGIFLNALKAVCFDLAKKLVIDGEGATKFIEVKVKGARTKEQAKKAAKAVANSVLVKTAIFGENPNWGRVAQAIGALGMKNVNDGTLKINFSPFDKKEILIDVDLNNGKESSSAYTCDLSYEYVRINAEYN
ncbi:MAG: bifunctional glutamate N-acetyltransferase/amino-acid acetyltransferase ArgJ [Candidatus Omnitrophica bacterium]|nr:bifunctional glutamate N-acetyltransferase/amino-acid acetyltransferase ArgJ [Candidatus Omnitrophota bacterium]